MDDEMTLREALHLLVEAYVRDSDMEDWSVGQGPEIPSLIEAWAVVIRAIRGLGGEEFEVELRETMSEGSEEARLQDAAIALVESIGGNVIAGMGIEIERVDGQTFKVSVYLAGDLPASSVYETR